MAYDVILVSLFLTLNIFDTLFSSVSIVNFEQANTGWVPTKSHDQCH